MGMLLRRHAEQRAAQAAAELEAVRAENENAAAEARVIGDAQAAAELEAPPSQPTPPEPVEQPPQSQDRGRRRR